VSRKGVVGRAPRLAENSPPKCIRAFRSAEHMLEAGLSLVRARQALHKARKDECTSSEAVAACRRRDLAWSLYWHGAFRLSGKSVPVVRRLLDARLNRFEREIVLVMLLGQVVLLDGTANTVEEVLGHLKFSPADALKALRCLNPSRRLCKSGTVGLGDESEPLAKREVFLDPALIDMVLGGKRTAASGWPVKTDAELYDYLGRLTHALQMKADAIDDIVRGYGSCADAYRWHRVTESYLAGLNATLKRQREWALSKVSSEFSKKPSARRGWYVFLALLGKELGHIPVDDTMFKGAGLARAACRKDEYPRSHMALLKSTSLLRAQGLMQPCGGMDAFLTDELQDLEECEFELTHQAVEKLGLGRRGRAKRASHYKLTTPRVKLQNLVLPETTQHCLSMALEQSRHFNVLFDTWGLGGHITYGRGVTMLFFGPPGTGKTAAAEALARELEKPILIADYSQIQNCFIGQTEKNIARVFRDAREHDAVLFWDEADAMFSDRDLASRTWEVRDVNVLLQELERFEGVCILATNRKFTLDKALERRISLKVPFERPNSLARREIFLRMLPAALPLEADVNVDLLATADLSGGEIKNVVLNAARKALVRRGAKGRVQMQDFQTAISELKRDSWGQRPERAAGFMRNRT
jgi:hypothetical protein